MKWQELYKTHKLVAWYSCEKQNIVCWMNESDRHYVIHIWNDVKSVKQIECFHRIVANRCVMNELRKSDYVRLSRIEVIKLLNDFSWFDESQAMGIN